MASTVATSTRASSGPTTIRSVAASLGLAAGGGLLVFLAGYPVQQPWLQLLAFAPLLVVCLRASSWRLAAVMGAAWGIARFVPLGIMLDGFGLWWLPATGLAVYLTALDVAFAVSVYAMRRAPAGVVVLGSAACFTAIEWIDSVLPMWGTARTLARSWAIAPELSGGVLRLGGPALLAFVIVAAQSIVVVAWLRRRGRVLGWLAAVASVVALCWRWCPPPETTATLRVAAIGWPRRGGETEAEALVADAAAEGAQLVVLPEAAFEVEPGERETFLAHWSEVAARHRVHLVVPFIDRQTPGNRLVVLGPDGARIGEYTKTHMIPVSETLPPGDGTRLVFEVDGARVGTMICQDDNFRDLAAAYVADGAELLVVPTNEGPPEVAPYHYRNARLRAIELPVTLVRAAARGTSAVIAPSGAVVAAFDHPTRGALALVADAPYRVRRSE